jgi:hypothetical protein
VRSDSVEPAAGELWLNPAPCVDMSVGLGGVSRCEAAAADVDPPDAAVLAVAARTPPAASGMGSGEAVRCRLTRAGDAMAE